MVLSVYKKRKEVLGMAKQIDYSKSKFYNWVLVLYPDCEEHVKAVKYIKEHYEYLMILHDKFTVSELKDDGEEKKPHWHIMLKFPTQRWRSSIAKNIGVEEHHIQKCEDPSSYARYLIHMDDEEKYQYGKSLVKGSEDMEDFFLEACSKKNITEIQKVNRIIEWIEQETKHISYTRFVRFLTANNLYDTGRRNTLLFTKCIEEKNFLLDRQYREGE